MSSHPEIHAESTEEGIKKVEDTLAVLTLTQKKVMEARIPKSMETWKVANWRRVTLMMKRG